MKTSINQSSRMSMFEPFKRNDRNITDLATLQKGKTTTQVQISLELASTTSCKITSGLLYMNGTREQCNTLVV